MQAILETRPPFQGTERRRNNSRRKLDGNIAEAFKLARGNISTSRVGAYRAESGAPIDPVPRREPIEAFSKVSGEFCHNQSKTPDRKYLFVYSFYTQLKVIKGTTVLGDNMVLQGGEKHCNSCGATTRTKMGSRFVPSPGETSDAKQTNKEKKTRQVCHISFYIFYSLFVQYPLVLFTTMPQPFDLRKSASYSTACLRPKRVKTGHMGGDVFCHPYLEIKGCGELLFF